MHQEEGVFGEICIFFTLKMQMYTACEKTGKRNACCRNLHLCSLRGDYKGEGARLTALSFLCRHPQPFG